MYMAKKTIWIISGEASGDIYGARLAEEIAKIAPDIRLTGMGGPKMKESGIDIMVDSTELGVVGLVEVLKKIFTFIGIFRGLVTKAIKERPSAVVLIDYPGFNIRFAKQMWKNNIPVIWYISPQVWAWRKSNIPRLATYCRKMMVIFPFEPEVYSGTGLDVEFVGHPLVEIVKGRIDPTIKRDPNTIALLPGSRSGEIKRLLHPMLETVSLMHEKHPTYKYVIAAPREKIYNMIKDSIEVFKQEHASIKLPEIEVSCGETGRWLQEAGTGLAASGTVTVEAAIAGLPLVVIYRINQLSFMAARLVIKLFRGFFTMTNIIADKRVFEEYLQHQVVAPTLVEALERIVPGGERREEVERDMESVTRSLTPGSDNACGKAAEVCVTFVNREAD